MPLQFPTSNIYQSKVAAWVRFSSHFPRFSATDRAKIADSGQRAGLSLEEEIILPLQGYQAPNAMDYQEIEPGIMTQLLMGANNPGEGRFTALGNALYKGLFGVSRSQARAIDSGAMATDLKFSDLQFQRPMKRMHLFRFALFAHDKNSAKTIDTIAHKFQMNMYPMIFDAKSTRVDSPNHWTIQIVENGTGVGASKVLSNDINLCVLSNFNVNRLDVTAPVLHESGFYAGLGLECTFYELEGVYRYDKRGASAIANAKLLSRSQIKVRGGAV